MSNYTIKPLSRHLLFNDLWLPQFLLFKSNFSEARLYLGELSSEGKKHTYKACYFHKPATNDIDRPS